VNRSAIASLDCCTNGCELLCRFYLDTYPRKAIGRKGEKN
jgi:hypothetical protein